MEKQARTVSELGGYFIRARIYSDRENYTICEDIETARHAIGARIQFGQRAYQNPNVWLVYIESVERVK